MNILGNTLTVFLYALIGLTVAVVIHVLVELPILWWQNSLPEWQTFLGFTNYEEFRIFDMWLGVIQFSLGIIVGLYLGVRKISKKTKKSGSLNNNK